MSEGLLAYLSPTGQEAFTFLKSIGMDPDLALAVCELKIPDTELWEVPGEPLIREDVTTD